MGRRLYVGNLSYGTTEIDLRDLFAQAGTVADAKVVMDRETGRPRGFAFVEMSSDQEALAATPRPASPARPPASAAFLRPIALAREAGEGQGEGLGLPVPPECTWQRAPLQPIALAGEAGEGQGEGPGPPVPPECTWQRAL